MFDLVTCFSKGNDFRLTVVSIAIGIASGLVTFHLLPRARSDSAAEASAVRIVVPSLAAGSGAWAAHFAAMMAYDPVPDIGFDWNATALSLMMGLGFAGTAFAVAGQWRHWLSPIASGSVLGSAIILMHYVGIEGMFVPGLLVWDRSLIAASMLLAIGFSIAAMATFGGGGSLVRRSSAGLLFGIAVISLHFSGMAAISVKALSSLPRPDDLLSGSSIGFFVAGVTALVMIATLASRLIENSTRRATETRQAFLSQHDPLTLLPNRMLFEELVNRELASATGENRSAALLCVDIKGLGSVNELFGYAMGDTLVAQVARTLQSTIGSQCDAARLSGSQFAVLVKGADAAGTAYASARGILDALGRTVRIEGNLLDVRPAIGGALFPADGLTYASILSNACIALARACEEGAAVARFFDPAMDADLRERSTLAGDLRNALGTGQLRLEYQPQFAIAPDSLSGFEALLRWDHPIRGAISPAKFIPIAEETGLILPLGEWVLREACREAATFTTPARMSVNVSSNQFRQAGFATLVSDILVQTGLEPSRLELEVTETLILQDLPHVREALQELIAMGVRIAIDDFGTGFSCLSTLHSFPFHTIKIDRSFTSKLGFEPKGTAIVKTVIDLARSLEMNVVAEGVETLEQMTFLRRSGCSEVQGYFCGRPRPIAEYTALVHPSGTIGQATEAAILRCA